GMGMESSSSSKKLRSRFLVALGATTGVLASASMEAACKKERAAPLTTASSTTPASTPTIMCARPSKEVCFTHADLVKLLRHPPPGGDIAAVTSRDPALTASWDSRGCLPAKDVRDDCCNVAQLGPDLPNHANGANGSPAACCYLFCEGACC